MPKKSVKNSAKKAVKKSVKKISRASGAGRPKGSGKFGCPTKAIRVPIHLEQEVIEFALRKNKTKKNTE
ncbi:MAG: hypothetical protein LBE12_09895 [Planctomycetaceae bacterium]|jgi:hypothetical protein|nr:hypothetical protein [Planctomycetaceae bacterium]